MSCAWGFRCKKDGTETDTCFNHGEHILRSIATCWPLIQQLWDTDQSGYIEVGIMGHSYMEAELWEFLQKHFEHGLELCDEYGGIQPLEEVQQ